MPETLSFKKLSRVTNCIKPNDFKPNGIKPSDHLPHMAMHQCCYLAKGAKRPSHTTNTIKFVRIPFDPCNSIKRFDLCPFDQKNSTYLQPPQSEHSDSNLFRFSENSNLVHSKLKFELITVPCFEKVLNTAAYQTTPTA